MSFGSMLFVLALLITATVAAPVAVATLVQRQTRAALWLRRHGRWLWAGAALFWLGSLVLDLAHDSAFARLDFVTSALGFLCTAGAALLTRPAPAHAASAIERALPDKE
jgi:hypothetical protein